MKPRLEEWAERLFGQGLYFFLPYLALYAVACGVNLPVSWTRAAFVILHAVTIGLFILYLPRLRQKLSRAEIVFWGVLLIALLIPGAYLEYPSDPWSHFQRIFRWQAIHGMREGEDKLKFSYFWAWTTMFWVPPIFRRTALGTYGAFSELLVGIQVFLLSRRLGFSRAWSALQTTAFFALFGTSLFGMRYYALSSTPLAYAAYLQTLIVLMDLIDGKEKVRRNRGLALLALIPLIALNHVQELVFAVASGSCLLLLANSRRHWILGGAGVFIASTLIGYFLYRFHPGAFRRIDFEQLSRFGTFKLWGTHYPQVRFLDTWGIHGLISLALALLFARRHPRIAALTLMPALLLLFLPYVLVSSWLIHPAHSYRLIFAMPTSLMLVAGLYEITRRLRWASLYVSAGVILILAGSPRFPWDGRLFMQFYRPPDDRSLLPQDQLAQWLYKNRHLNPDCQIITDDLTLFALTTHLGKPLRQYRLQPDFTALRLDTLPKLLKQTGSVPRVCAVISASPSRIPPASLSPVAQWSRHWDPAIAEMPRLVSENFVHLAEALPGRGWTHTSVTPYYEFYEPPSDWPLD